MVGDLVTFWGRRYDDGAKIPVDGMTIYLEGELNQTFCSNGTNSN